MRGHEAVLAMRRAGFSPVCVWLHDTGGPYTPWTHPRTGWQADTNQAHVEIAPDESPRRLDLRFAAGLTVHLLTTSERRRQAFEESAAECGVGRLLGSVLSGAGHQLRVNRMTDTAGVFNWDESHG